MPDATQSEKKVASVASSATIGVRKLALRRTAMALHTAQSGNETAQKRSPQDNVVLTDASPFAMVTIQMTRSITNVTMATVAQRPAHFARKYETRRDRNVQY